VEDRWSRIKPTNNPLCRGVGGIERDIAFEGASAQGAFCWVAPGVSPGSHLRLSVASINHRTIKKMEPISQRISLPRRCLSPRLRGAAAF